MADGREPEKIAILGGGIAALVTAFELTRPADWRERIESVTIYQMGWRLGGKCASSRGPQGRIEEHGIHGFLGSYFNALPLIAACYDELGRPPGTPLSSFEEALIPENFGVLWERRGGAMRAWPQWFPTNSHRPRDLPPTEDLLARALAGVVEALAFSLLLLVGDWLKRALQGPVERFAARLGRRLAQPGPHPGVRAAHRAWRAVQPLVQAAFAPFDGLRRLFFTLDHVAALVGGALADDVAARGFAVLDGEDFAAWLARHGAHPTTISSPLAINYINMTYQYPDGDTSRSPRMAAGVYVQWALQAAGYMGSFIWRFAAGTGETLIAPLYEVLRRRGVQFAFFHKVEALRLSSDKRSVAAVDMTVQASLKPGLAAYEPLIDVAGLPCWPPRPLFGQLVEGEAMEAVPDLDLESYWTPWTGERRTLHAGRDYDRLVFAISIGAVPHLCQELLEARPQWRDMRDNIPAYLTQAMQIWVSKDAAALGWKTRLKPGDTIVTTTYLNPQNGHAEFSSLLEYEAWPSAARPKGLWYFCGLMTQDEPEPPFSDHDYPRRQRDRVKHQSVQYLQAGIGPLLPGAVTDANHPPGDPFGFDFSLLVDADDPARVGVARFESQFWRANIDPTERYVASPPASTQFRLKAWESGFDNLVLAGDWIYTGINVGSVEGTVMSGKLAAHALTQRPPLNEILGYR